MGQAQLRVAVHFACISPFAPALWVARYFLLSFAQMNQALSLFHLSPARERHAPPFNQNAHFLCIFHVSEVGGVCSELGVSLHFKYK